jgi:putative pantetheine hydrolase
MATVIGVIATDATLTKAQCQKVSGLGHDGLARAIHPVHTLLDATGQLVLTWKFRNAFPAVYRVSPLDATSSDLVIETVELAFDSMDVEV